MKRILNISGTVVFILLLPCIHNTVECIGETDFEGFYEMVDGFINASNSYVIPLNNSAMTETRNNKTYGKWNNLIKCVYRMHLKDVNTNSCDKLTIYQLKLS